MNKKKRRILITSVILTICLLVALLSKNIVVQKQKRQIEAERLEKERLEQEHLALEAELYEKAFEAGEWDEVEEIRMVENIEEEVSVCMGNLALVIYRHGVYRQGNNRRRTYGFFLFSDGWVYVATEYYKMDLSGTVENVYRNDFNDGMWEHLSDWKCLGRMSSDEMAWINVNLWQAGTADYLYFPGNGEGLEGPASDSKGSGTIVGVKSISTTYSADDGKKIELPSFAGAGYVSLSSDDNRIMYDFWERSNYERVRYTKDEFINNVMQNILGNKFFILWQETEF